MSHAIEARMLPPDDKLVAGVVEELRQSAATMSALAEEAAVQVVEAAGVLIEALSSGHSVWLCGNGGSAAQAQHLAAELVGRFERIRRPLAASALSADTAVVTAVGNDFGFDEIYARQLRALARPGDVLIALSTSGESANIVAAAACARELGCRVIALTGRRRRHRRRARGRPGAGSGEARCPSPGGPSRGRARHLQARRGRARVNAGMSSLVRNELLEPWFRTTWPRPPSGGRVAAVIVSYNTVELVAHLLLSLYRVLERDALTEIVLVDNASADGSREFLGALAADGLITLIANDRQRYHGPALNQALSYLAQREQLRASVDYVWILDSDAAVLRADTLARGLTTLREERAALAGEFEYLTHPQGYAQLWSLLLDPWLVWQPRFAPFEEAGAPGARLQRDLRAAGLPLANFPFGAMRYVHHLGSASLRVVASRGLETNRYFAWAKAWEEIVASIHDRPHGPLAYRRFRAGACRRLLTALEPRAFASVCRRPGRLQLQATSWGLRA